VEIKNTRKQEKKSEREGKIWNVAEYGRGKREVRQRTKH